MQDATPLTLGDEFSGYTQRIKNDLDNIEKTFKKMFSLAQGGTAVGTGINAPKSFENKFIGHLKKITKIPFYSSNEVENLRNCSYREIAEKIILEFCGNEFKKNEVRDLVHSSYKNFRVEYVI